MIKKYSSGSILETEIAFYMAKYAKETSANSEKTETINKKAQFDSQAIQKVYELNEERDQWKKLLPKWETALAQGESLTPETAPYMYGYSSGDEESFAGPSYWGGATFTRGEGKAPEGGDPSIDLGRINIKPPRSPDSKSSKSDDGFKSVAQYLKVKHWPESSSFFRMGQFQDMLTGETVPEAGVDETIEVSALRTGPNLATITTYSRLAASLLSKGSNFLKAIKTRQEATEFYTNFNKFLGQNNIDPKSFNPQEILKESSSKSLLKKKAGKKIKKFAQNGSPESEDAETTWPQYIAWLLATTFRGSYGAVVAGYTEKIAENVYTHPIATVIMKGVKRMYTPREGAQPVLDEPIKIWVRGQAERLVATQSGKIRDIIKQDLGIDAARPAADGPMKKFNNLDFETKSEALLGSIKSSLDEIGKIESRLDTSKTIDTDTLSTETQKIEEINAEIEKIKQNIQELSDLRNGARQSLTEAGTIAANYKLAFTGSVNADLVEKYIRGLPLDNVLRNQVITILNQELNAAMMREIDEIMTREIIPNITIYNEAEDLKANYIQSVSDVSKAKVERIKANIKIIRNRLELDGFKAYLKERGIQITEENFERIKTEIDRGGEGLAKYLSGMPFDSGKPVTSIIQASYGKPQYTQIIDNIISQEATLKSRGDRDYLSAMSDVFSRIKNNDSPDTIWNALSSRLNIYTKAPQDVRRNLSNRELKTKWEQLKIEGVIDNTNNLWPYESDGSLKAGANPAFDDFIKYLINNGEGDKLSKVLYVYNPNYMDQLNEIDIAVATLSARSISKAKLKSQNVPAKDLKVFLLEQLYMKKTKFDLNKLLEDTNLLAANGRSSPPQVDLKDIKEAITNKSNEVEEQVKRFTKTLQDNRLPPQGYDDTVNEIRRTLINNQHFSLRDVANDIRNNEVKFLLLESAEAFPKNSYMEILQLGQKAGVDKS